MATYTISTIASGLEAQIAISPGQEIATLHDSTTSELDSDQLRFYCIEVRSQGNLVAEHVITADNALKAINLVESEYGGTVEAETTLIENGDHHSRKFLVPKNWHGYLFEARVIDL